MDGTPPQPPSHANRPRLQRPVPQSAQSSMDSQPQSNPPLTPNQTPQLQRPTSGDPASATPRPGTPPRPGSSTVSRPGAASQQRPTPPSSAGTPKKSPIQGSGIGQIISIGIIVVLGIALLFQIFSKTGLRSEIRELRQQTTQLQQDKDQLNARVAELSNQAAQQPPSQPAPNQPAPSQPNSGSDATDTPPVVPTTPANGQLTAGALSFYPVKYRERDYQRIAQTLRLPQDVTVTGLQFRGNGGSGSGGKLRIHKASTPGRAGTTNRMAEKAFAPQQVPQNMLFTIALDEPLKLEANTDYVVILETTDEDSSFNVGYTPTNATQTGIFSVFTQTLDAAGTVTHEKHTWNQLTTMDLAMDVRIQPSSK